MAEGGIGSPSDYLAAERTFLAWIRTGLALMGFGFVVARVGLFLREIAMTTHDLPLESTGASLWMGTALLLLGAMVNVAASINHVRLVGRLNRGPHVTPRQQPVNPVARTQRDRAARLPVSQVSARLGARPPWAAHRLPRCRARVPPVAPDGDAVHEHIAHAHRELVRLGVRRPVGDRGRVEHDHRWDRSRARDFEHGRGRGQ